MPLPAPAAAALVVAVAERAAVWTAVIPAADAADVVAADMDVACSAGVPVMVQSPGWLLSLVIRLTAAKVAGTPIAVIGSATVPIAARRAMVATAAAAVTVAAAVAVAVAAVTVAAVTVAAVTVAAAAAVAAAQNSITRHNSRVVASYQAGRRRPKIVAVPNAVRNAVPKYLNIDLANEIASGLATDLNSPPVAAMVASVLSICQNGLPRRRRR